LAVLVLKIIIYKKRRFMKKKLGVLLFLVILPIVLIQFYTYYFEFAGNWLEDYRNYFKLGFLVVSILSTGWLAVISKKEKSWVWFSLSLVLLILLLAYLYFAIIIINTSF
jgi:hypothetical protein